MSRNSERYRAYEINIEEADTSAGVRGFLFTVLDGDEILFRLKQAATNVVAAVRYKGAVTAPELAYERGLRRVHGKIDLEDYEPGEYTEYVLTMEENEAKRSNSMPTTQVQARLLQALMNGRARKPDYYLTEPTDIEGFCEVADIEFNRFRIAAALLEGQGYIKLMNDLARLEAGEFYITDHGVGLAARYMQEAETMQPFKQSEPAPPASGAKAPWVIILTAIPEELQAVHDQLQRYGDVTEETHRTGTIYYRGSFPTKYTTWDVIVAQAGAGNVKAATAAAGAIARYDPDVILFVGIAGGVKDVVIGDVVVAENIQGYEYGKARAKRVDPRAEVRLPSYLLGQRAEAESLKADWMSRLDGELPVPHPTVYVKPIAAGEKVVAHRFSAVAKYIRENYGHVLAVEMEGLGFLEAARVNPDVEALVIRGISDLLGEERPPDAKVLAARHASAFAFEVLAKIDPALLRAHSK